MIQEVWCERKQFKTAYHEQSSNSKLKKKKSPPHLNVLGSAVQHETFCSDIPLQLIPDSDISPRMFPLSHKKD